MRRMKNLVLLRVGIDAGCGGIQGPLFTDGSFDFVCIPDNKRVSVHTYGNLCGKDERRLVDYFPESRRKGMAGQHIHLDPEFETFTYGDPTTPKRSLRTLKPGDLLVFYCGLQKWDADGGWNREHRPALYLAGFFEVALAGMAGDFEKKVLKTEFGKNFHVRYRTVFEKQKEDLVLVKGGPGSRLFRRGAPDQQHGKGPGRQAAQGAFSGNAEGVRQFWRPRFYSTKSTTLGGPWVRGQGSSVSGRPGVDRSGGNGTHHHLHLGLLRLGQPHAPACRSRRCR